MMQVADDKEAEEAAKGLKPGSEEAAAAAAAAAKQASSPEMAAMLAIDSTRAHTASIRVQVRGDSNLSCVTQCIWAAIGLFVQSASCVTCAGPACFS
jgi:hypothetical protein